jgi:predicted nucleotidyltransferase component of viral defense system
MTITSTNTPKKKLTRQQLELINRRSLKYRLDIAQKDYFLALVLELIYDSPLKNKLIFKGGTALHHCYLSQKRFSEDIDFTSLDNEISFEEVKEVIEEDDTFVVDKVFESNYTIKIERLKYEGLLGQNGSIKVEIDRHQNVVLPGREIQYKNVWNIPVSPILMDGREILAEKLRAISQRARYRDFYDLYFLLTELQLDLNFSIELLKQKEIRKPILSKNIINNWQIAREEKEKDLQTVFVSEPVEDEVIQEILENIQFEDIQ